MSHATLHSELFFYILLRHPFATTTNMLRFLLTITIAVSTSSACADLLLRLCELCCCCCFEFHSNRIHSEFMCAELERRVESVHSDPPYPPEINSNQFQGIVDFSNVSFPSCASLSSSSSSSSGSSDEKPTISESSKASNVTQSHHPSTD